MEGEIESLRGLPLERDRVSSEHLPPPEAELRKLRAKHDRRREWLPSLVGSPEYDTSRAGPAPSAGAGRNEVAG